VVRGERRRDSMTSDPYDDISNWQLYAFAAIGAVVLIGFSLLGQTGRGQLYAITFLMLAISVRIFWPLRSRFWFWALASVVLAIHVAFIELLYPPDAPLMPGYKVLLIEMADFAVFFFLVLWTNERFRRSR
jgi:hypothetical protein